MSAVTQWYVDQIVTYPGLLIVVFLCVVAFRNIRSHKQELPLRLRVLLYGAHILSVMTFVALVLVNVILIVFKQIAPTWNQHTICFVTYTLVTTNAAGFLMCVINLFFERLCISFDETAFKVSKRTRYSFFIVVNASWVIIGMVYLSSIDPMPYNIYTEQVDHRNGVTCSAHIQGVNANRMITITFVIIAFVISSSNLLVWVMFVSKLRDLITDTHTENPQQVSKDFLCLMKEQTMLIGIAVFSSIILWTLQGFFQFGHSLPAFDIAVTTIVMFLTFRKLSADYFSMLKCDQLTICCCGVFEKYLSSRISQELQLSNAMQSATDVGSGSEMPTTSTIGSEMPTTSTVVTTVASDSSDIRIV
eukprot:22523_1